MKRDCERRVGMVSSDDTVLLYAAAYVGFHGTHTLEAALLRPGDVTWTTVRRDNLHIVHRPSEWGGNCSMAYRHGKMVLCNGGRWWFLMPVAQAQAATSGSMPDEDDVETQSSYILESRGEVLWVFVQIKTKSSFYKDIGEYGVGDVDSLASAFSVSMYALQEEEGAEPRWVKMDSRSLNDRVLFLGCPSSFAVDAALLGMNGGSAYFVDRRLLYGRVWSKLAQDQCRMFRYSFRDDISELVDDLFDGWGSGAYVWITLTPRRAPRER